LAITLVVVSFYAGWWFGEIIKWGCSWQAWTALYTYFSTQPLPTPLAWYAHQLPHLLLQFSALMTLCIETIIPFLIFFPRRLRFVAAFFILFLQSLILLTGNYNFFNLQTMLLCLVLFDDAAIQTLIPRKLICYMKQPVSLKPHSKKGVAFVTLFVIFTVFLSVVQFQMRFIGKVPTVMAVIDV